MSPPCLAGSLPHPSIYQIFQSMGASARTGVLHLEREGTHKTIHFKNGRIRFATTSLPHERLGALAVGQHLATWWQVQEAAKEIGAGRRLGTVLVDHGILSGAERTRLVRDQIRGVVLQALSWSEGTFRFEEGPPREHERITLDWGVADAILEQARCASDEGTLWEEVGGPGGRLIPRGDVPLPEQVNSGEQRVLAVLGGSCTVEEVIHVAAVPAVTAVRTIAALARAGCLEVQRPVGATRASGDAVGSHRGHPAGRSGARAAGSSREALPRPAGRYALRGRPGEREDPAVTRAAFHRRGEEEHPTAKDAKEVRDACAGVFLERAGRLVRQGRLLEAIPALREALRLRPDSAVANYRLGQCLAATKNPAEARLHFQRAQDLEPDNPRYRAALASSHEGPTKLRRGMADRLSRWLRQQDRRPKD